MTDKSFELLKKINTNIKFMQKIKKTFLYFLGAFLTFTFGPGSAFAQELSPLYGVNFATSPGTGASSNLTFWEKVVSVTLSPIFMVAVIVLVIIIGTVIFIKKRK